MDSEQEKKSQYINENIISKGYNLEEFSKFVITELQLSIDHISLEELKIQIERFKSKGLKDIYRAVRDENKKSVPEKESPTDFLYLPEKYSFTTKTQEKNKLYDIENEHKIIKIIASDPTKIKIENKKKNNFYYLYTIKCTQIKSEAKRTYEDIEWLRNQLVVHYPWRFVPPLPKESEYLHLGLINKNDTEIEIENKKIKYVNKFFDALITKKIFRTCPILLIFLEANDSVMKMYKTTLDNENFELKQNLENFKTLKGKLQIEFTKEKLYKLVNFDKNNYTDLIDVYSKLETSINTLCVDFKNLSIHMKEISSLFEKLSGLMKFTNNCGKITTSYLQLNTIFSTWSSVYERQNDFFNQDIKTQFKYINMQLKEFDTNFFKKFCEIKNKYESFGGKLNKKKEDLFVKKDYNKWGLEPGTEKEIGLFQNDRRRAFKVMLYKETMLLEEEKKNLSLIMHYMDKQFDKLMKQQGEEIKYFFEHLKENNQLIMGDSFNMIKLFSLCIE